MEDELTSEEKAYAREQISQGKACPHCGGLHLRACRRVRRFVFRKQDEIQEVEFWRDGQWDEDGIIWPEDVYEGEEADGEDSPAPSEAVEARPEADAGAGPVVPSLHPLSQLHEIPAPQAGPH
jgi:hypothetical protein